jgi:hypothetical protein
LEDYEKAAPANNLVPFPVLPEPTATKSQANVQNGAASS